LSPLEEIIKRILADRPDLTLEDVKQMITQKKREVGGLLTDDGAAYIVATELGVNLAGKSDLKTEINIRDLVPGVNDASITGRVIWVNSIQTFSRPDKTSGKLARMTLADKTGTINVVLWDDKADLVDQIAQNRIVKVLHGYVRDGLNGKPELHVGMRGEVVINPTDIKPEDFPEMREFFKKISELKDGDEAEVMATITKVSDRPRVYTGCPSCLRKVTQQEDKWICERCGPVATPINRVIVDAVLEDGTGVIDAVFYGEQAEKLLGITADEVKKLLSYTENLGAQAASFEKTLRKEITVSGRITYNQFSGKLQLVARKIFIPA